MGPAVCALAVLCASGCASAHKSPRTVDWPRWGNTAENTRFAKLGQINRSNVSRLQPAWSRGEGPLQYEWETFPIVVGRTMYYDTDTDQVLAVDAATGKIRWSYTPEVNFLANPRVIGVAPVSRGVTYGDGRIYLLTADDQLIALSASRGKVLWHRRVANPAAGFTENSPGTYWHGRLIIGGPAGDAGLRGFVAAYDARTGRRLWRTYVIPPRGSGWLPAEGGHGGGDVWMPPTVDPRTGTAYISTGDPTPAFTNAGRPGCNPYADSTLALNARTGKIEWTHTEVCEDSWDYDTDQSPVLFDLNRDGRKLRAVGDGSKSGFYSILDASSGKLIARTPYITRYSEPHLRPTEQGVVVCPGIYGGLEYGPPAFSPSIHRLFLLGSNMCMRYKLASQQKIEEHESGADDLEGETEQVGPATGVIAAIKPRSGKIAWRRSLPRPAIGGTLATAGGLVLAGDDNGYLYAFDARNGKTLWRQRLGLKIGSAPLAYKVNGVEYIAIVAGGSQVPARGEAPGGEGRLFVFRLPRHAARHG